MTIATFEDLCSSLCELEGSPAPTLERDEDGNLAIALTVDDVDVTLAHEPAHSNTAFLFAAIGPLPPGDELGACRTLMGINAALLQDGGTCFSRNPQTGELLLQSSYAFADGTSEEAYGRIRELAATARRSRHQLAVMRETQGVCR